MDDPADAVSQPSTREIWSWAELLPALSLDRFRAAHPRLGLAYPVDQATETARWYVTEAGATPDAATVDATVGEARRRLHRVNRAMLQEIDALVRHDFAFDPPDGRMWVVWVFLLRTAAGRPHHTGRPHAELPVPGVVLTAIRQELTRLARDQAALERSRKSRVLSEWDSRVHGQYEVDPIEWIDSTLEHQAFHRAWSALIERVDVEGRQRVLEWGRAELRSCGQSSSFLALPMPG